MKPLNVHVKKSPTNPLWDYSDMLMCSTRSRIAFSTMQIHLRACPVASGKTQEKIIPVGHPVGWQSGDCPCLDFYNKDVYFWAPCALSNQWAEIDISWEHFLSWSRLIKQICWKSLHCHFVGAASRILYIYLNFLHVIFEIIWQLYWSIRQLLTV